MSETTTVTVEVTQQDIDACAHSYDAIRRAVERLVHPNLTVVVFPARVWVGPESFALPMFVQDKIVRGFIGQPFTFTLDLPTECVKAELLK